MAIAALVSAPPGTRGPGVGTPRLLRPRSRDSPVCGKRPERCLRSNASDSSLDIHSKLLMVFPPGLSSVFRSYRSEMKSRLRSAAPAIPLALLASAFVGLTVAVRPHYGQL